MARKTFESAVLDFAQSLGLLMRRVRAAAGSGELRWAEGSVLKHLAQQGAATTAELARAQGMRPQSMRSIVASLEEMGMVGRRAHATDGRQVNLVLTARGAAEQKSAGDAKRNWLAQAIAGLEAGERETLFAAGEIVRRMVERDPQ